MIEQTSAAERNHGEVRSVEHTAEPESVNGHVIPDQHEVTRALGPSPLAEKMGLRYIELTPERSVAVMPVSGNEQNAGLLHGGAYCVIGETLGSIAANIYAGEGRFAVGIDINATHTGSAVDGWVTATCTAIQLGNTVCVHEIVIEDATGHRCSTVRITNLIRTRK